MEVKSRYSSNYFFLVFICLFFVVGFYTLIKNPVKTSEAENRTLTEFQHFTIKGFLDGSFQSNFENALSDQFPGSEKIRTVYGETIGNLPSWGVNELACDGRYIFLDGKQYTNTFFDCDDYIISPPMTEDPKQKKVLETNILEEDIKKYNHINSISDTYYYFIEEAQSFNFATGERVLDLETTLRKELKGHYSIASLQFNNYEEFKKIYYKTDHHWNHFGQLQGYQDIIKLLGINTTAVNTELATNHEYYFGSKARDSRIYNSADEFVFYTMDLPPHDTFVNRKKQEYGHQEDYLNHKYKSTRLFNHYGYVFGGDYGEVLFDFHQPERGNLLIISNSFDNPINSWIAQYFNKTYAVDLRHYKNHIGEKFVLSEYIKNNNIDKTLLIIQPRFIYNWNSNQGLEL